jgi:hypothetical protein
VKREDQSIDDGRPEVGGHATSMPSRPAHVNSVPRQQIQGRIPISGGAGGRRRAAGASRALTRKPVIKKGLRTT